MSKSLTNTAIRFIPPALALFYAVFGPENTKKYQKKANQNQIKIRRKKL
jgi:hypothetical protein